MSRLLIIFTVLFCLCRECRGFTRCKATSAMRTAVPSSSWSSSCYNSAFGASSYNSALGASSKDKDRESIRDEGSWGDYGDGAEQRVVYGVDGLAQPAFISSREFAGEIDRYNLLHPLDKPAPKTEVLTFISSNKLKIAEVRSILEDDRDGRRFPFQLICQDAELLEPQATPIEISRAKCIQAVHLSRQDGEGSIGPVVVEDTSLHFNALNGMPGPYIKSFYESLGNEGLSKLLEGFDDRTAYAQCVVSMSFGVGSEILTFVGISEGEIATPIELSGAKGLKGFGWDPLFIPNGGGGRSFGEMDMQQKNKLSHRFKAFRELKAYINERAVKYRFGT